MADTDANFALFGPFADREAVFEALLARGVLIRVTGPEGWLRVSIGTAQEMALFRSALLEVDKAGDKHGGWAMSRTGRIERETSESRVLVELDLDGSGITEIDTGVPFYDHMLTALGKHSLMNLTVQASGDVQID